MCIRRAVWHVMTGDTHLSVRRAGQSCDWSISWYSIPRSRDNSRVSNTPSPGPPLLYKQIPVQTFCADAHLCENIKYTLIVSEPEE